MAILLSEIEVEMNLLATLLEYVTCYDLANKRSCFNDHLSKAKRGAWLLNEGIAFNDNFSLAISDDECFWFGGRGLLKNYGITLLDLLT